MFFAFFLELYSSSSYNKGRVVFAILRYLFLFRVDSVMLLEEGFEMVSSDASDKMLKEAYKTRWDRRKEPAFDKWSEFFLTTTQYI